MSTYMWAAVGLVLLGAIAFWFDKMVPGIVCVGFGVGLASFRAIAERL